MRHRQHLAVDVVVFAAVDTDQAHRAIAFDLVRMFCPCGCGQSAPLAEQPFRIETQGQSIKGLRQSHVKFSKFRNGFVWGTTVMRLCRVDGSLHFAERARNVRHGRTFKLRQIRIPDIEDQHDTGFVASIPSLVLIRIVEYNDPPLFP